MKKLKFQAMGTNKRFDFLRRPESIALVLCLFMVILLGTTSKYFFNSYNLESLIATTAPEGIVALGMMMLLITGVFDLSVGSVMCLGGLSAAVCLNAGMPVPVAIALGLASGALIGFFNGVLVEVVGINPLITTIGMMYIVRGITELTLVSKGKEGFTNFPASFTNLGQGKFLGILYMFWIMLLLAVIFGIFISTRPTGARMYLIGGNETAAKFMGVDKKKIRIALFMTTATLAALAGILINARSGSANRYIGQKSHMNIIIASVVGGGSLSGGKGNMLGALLGTLFLALLNNSFNLFELNQHIQSLTQGIVLLIVVVADGYISIRKRRALGKE